ncbi:hypothetical protein [Micromonospora okii]|uniref:hypothetical protein n=1 Tax=Micromonospora okii TaxID=1182970 RepID=UPI001E4FF3A5|nr:hypothetical protein [Micromonospora okii]
MTAPDADLTVTVVLRYRDRDDQVRTRPWTTTGWQVTPGLAVHETYDHDTGGPTPRRYALTHLPSGLMLAGPSCADHMAEAVTAAVGCDVDWTADGDTIRQVTPPDGLRHREDAYGHELCPRTVWRPVVPAKAGVR